MNRTFEPTTRPQVGSLLLTVFIAGALAGVFILAASSGGIQPLAVFLFAVVILSTILVFNYAVGKFELFVLAGIFFAFCFRGIDFYLFYQHYFIKGTLRGIRITLPDAVFLYVFIAWLKRVFYHEESFRPFEKPNLLLLFTFLFMVASNFVATYPLRSFFQTVMAAKVFLYYLCFSQTIRNGEQLKTILWVFILLLCFQDGLGFLQRATGSTLGLDILGGETRETAVGLKYVSRVTGTTPHPNNLARFIGFMWPVLMALLFVKGIKRKYMWLMTGVLISSLATLFFTLSRSGWLGALIGVPMITFLSLRRLRMPTRNIILSFTVISLILFASLLAFSSDFRMRLYLEESKYRFPGFSPLEAAYKDFMDNPRVPMAKVTLNMIKHNPILGVGQGHFWQEKHRYDTTPQAAAWYGLELVHCMPLLVAAENGIAAALFLLAFLFMIFWGGLKAARTKNHFLAAVIWGLLAGEITFFFTASLNVYEIGQDPMNWVMLGLLAAVGKMSDKEVYKTGFLEKSSA